MDKVNLDLTAPGLANKERINKPVIAIRLRESSLEICMNTFLSVWHIGLPRGEYKAINRIRADLSENGRSQP